MSRTKSKARDRSEGQLSTSSITSSLAQAASTTTVDATDQVVFKDATDGSIKLATITDAALQGPVGPQGPAGADGPAGPAGADGSFDGSLKTINGNSLVGTGDVTISSTDQLAETYAYRAFRSGSLTHYPGFNNGKAIAFVGGQTQGFGGSFSSGSFSGGPNFGMNMAYYAIAVRTS